MIRPTPLIASTKSVAARLAQCSKPAVGSVCRFSTRRRAAVTRRPFSNSRTESTAPAPAQEEQQQHRRPPSRLEQGGSREDVLRNRPNLWLRDACPCEKCVDPDSGQKTFSTTQLGVHPKHRSMEFAEDGSLTVVWEDDPLSTGKDHISKYPASMLYNAENVPRHCHWDRDTYEDGRRECRISYKDWIAGGSKFWNIMGRLASKGLVFVYDVPEGDEQAVERISEQIGPIQETFYGRTWDVQSKPQAENVAYTNQFLGLHQDLLYYPDPPRIQLLHCLANECRGGESLFSDGIGAANRLARSDSETAQVLRTIPLAYHYNKNGNVYYAERPIMRVTGHTSNHIEAVWWSPPFQAPLVPVPKGLRQLSLAMRQFQTEIERPENLVTYKMRPGECVIFDNWRVLHGRNQFDTSSGKRWLKGAYIANRDFHHRLAGMPSGIVSPIKFWRFKPLLRLPQDQPRVT